MPVQVTDIRANLNENIVHAANVLGRSGDRRKVFEAIYHGKRRVKTVDDIVRATGLKSVRVLQEGGKLHANHIVEKTKKDGQTAYEKYDIYTQHKPKVLALVDHPEKVKKVPTKQTPAVSEATFHIRVPGRKPRAIPVTVDDIHSFRKIKKVTNIDSSLPLGKMAESKLKAGLKKIIGETHSFKDWGGEKNDLYTSKLVYGGKRRRAAFALKGKGTKGPLTPKKMGKNGDQIARLVSSAADMFFVLYHGKIDESVISQLEAFAVGKAISGGVIYYGVIDGDDLNRLYQAYGDCFK